MKVILEIEGERYPLATYAWEVHKQIRDGICCSSAQDGALTVSIAHTDDDGQHLPSLAADIFSTFSGSMTAYKETQRRAFRLMQWKRARIIRYNSHFDKYGESLNTYLIQPLDLQIGALRMKLDGSGWRQVAEEPQAHAAPPPEEEKKEGIKCSLYFRRPADYNGSFGFDWLRTGDTGEPGDHWYRDIMADIPGYSALQQYDDLVATQYHSFTEGWKEGHPVYGGNSRYVVPWLTLMPGATARLRLKLDVEENPEERIELRFGNPRDAQHLSLSFTEIPTEAGAYYHNRELEITCLEKFNNDITLHARAGDTGVGRLVIAGHRHMKKIQVAMITVKSRDKEKKPTSKIPNKRIEERLRRYLGQAYIVPEFFYLDLNLTVIPEYRERVAVYNRRKILERVVDVPINHQGDIKEILFRGQPLLNSYFWHGDAINTSHPDGIKHWGSFHNFLNAMLGQQNPALREDLENTFKLYFFNESGTGATVGELKGQAIRNEEALRTRAAVIFAVAYDRDTPTHELLHCLGLDHTFVESGKPAEKYRFIESWTDNMMDYEPRGGKSNRFSLWHWQIKKLWRYLENL